MTIEQAKNDCIELQKRINRAVKDNFGYCPHELWFDELLDERNRILSATGISLEGLERWAKEGEKDEH